MSESKHNHVNLTDQGYKKKNHHIIKSMYSVKWYGFFMCLCFTMSGLRIVVPGFGFFMGFVDLAWT